MPRRELLMGNPSSSATKNLIPMQLQSCSRSCSQTQVKSIVSWLPGLIHCSIHFPTSWSNNYWLSANCQDLSSFPKLRLRSLLLTSLMRNSKRESVKETTQDLSLQSPTSSDTRVDLDTPVCSTALSVALWVTPLLSSSSTSLPVLLFQWQMWHNPPRCGVVAQSLSSVC